MIPSSHIRIIGPKDSPAPGQTAISTVSHATGWQRGLSPFVLGPVSLPDGARAQNVENAWQFSKVYRMHIESNGEPTREYREWARRGFLNPQAIRYPMGKGARPEYSIWGSEKLDYVAARQAIYWPIYRDAVKGTNAFARLADLVAKGPVTLFDFDGRDHDARGETLGQVILDPRQKMGHAFVLKALLIYGVDVTPEQVLEFAPAPSPVQADFFGERPRARARI